jgi:hypothetical protein
VARDSAPEGSLVAFYLKEANQCPRAALAMACASIEVLTSMLDRGFYRMKPTQPTLPPKERKPSILTTGEHDDGNAMDE